MPIINLAFYQFRDLSLLNLTDLKTELKAVCGRLGMRGSILLSTEGVNASLAGPFESIREFQQYLEKSLGWTGLHYKESESDRIPFKRMLVKVKKEIIACGDPTIRPLEKTAIRMNPMQLKDWLDAGEDFCLLDTRNAYEVELGTFEKATHFNIKHFRDFFKKDAELEKLDRARPLVLFCTGGIRCEKASVMALQKGFEEVYQLDGGILNYFEQCGEAHFSGRCFVFDGRVSLDHKLGTED